MRKLSSTVRLVAVFALALIMLAGCVMQATTYTVNFNTDGGNYIPSAQVQQNQTVAEPTPPTKDGYTFAGWYKQGSNNPFNFATKITSNITLVARWTQNGSQGGGGNTGTGGTGTTTGITVSQTEHLKVETDPNGLKITVDSNAIGGSIWVEGVPLSIERHAHRYEQGDTSVDQKVYIFPFVTQGNSYKVSLGCEFLDDNKNWSVETTPQAVKAGGGSPNSYDLTKFLASKVTGTFDRQNGVHVWLSQTTINSPDDIIKDYDVIQSFWFEFWGELGRRGDSNGQCGGVSSDDSNFASKLKGLTNKCRVGDFPSDEDIAEKGYTYTFSARIKFKLYNLDDSFVTDNIWCDNVYTFSSDVISIPSETDHLKVESDPNGLKITVKNPDNAPLYRHNPSEDRYQSFDIGIFDMETGDEIPVHIDSESRLLEYTLPIVEKDRTYKVRLHTSILKNNRKEDVLEYAKSTAGGGVGTDFIKLDKFTSSTVDVSFDDVDGFTVTSNIPVYSESDLFKDPSKVVSWRIQKTVFIGPEGYWDEYPGVRTDWGDARDLWNFDKDNSVALHDFLNAPIELFKYPTLREWSEHDNLYTARLQLGFKMKNDGPDRGFIYFYLNNKDKYSPVHTYTGTGLVDCGPNLYVSSTGSDTTGTGSSSAPFASLGKALVRMYANNHDSYEYTIHVSGTLTGTAAEIRNMPAQKLTIKKAAGASSAILDGTGKHDTVLKIHTNIPVFLDGLTIQNANATHNAGGIEMSGTVEIKNCLIQNNTTSVGGGGITNWGNLTITDSIIKNNTAHDAGGGIETDGTLIVKNCQITDNIASNGGGITIHDRTNSNATIENTDISRNRANAGAGIFNEGKLTAKNITVTDNIGKWNGGLVCQPNSISTELSGAIVIKDNIATYENNSSDPWNLCLIREDAENFPFVTVTGSLVGSDISISAEDYDHLPLIVAKNYTQYNTGVAPTTYFHIDDSTNSVTLNTSGDVVISTNPWE